MTRTTSKLAPPSLNFRTTPTGGLSTQDVRVNVHQGHIHGTSSVESSVELLTSVSEAKTFSLVHFGLRESIRKRRGNDLQSKALSGLHLTSIGRLTISEASNVFIRLCFKK
ncbi:hypothetical protein AVEN_169874-1 [Araneus ventricosus]|uniref:Uncharacterized protein n=1 Tax=Araneus ventricosus TaxID=182803 RepID=A0A4Y2LA63_ARAVE|nr:hypothetical protein AVEN_169874-1 [Araneus ventricosus]